MKLFWAMYIQIKIKVRGSSKQIPKQCHHTNPTHDIRLERMKVLVHLYDWDVFIEILKKTTITTIVKQKSEHYFNGSNYLRRYYL